MTNQLSRFFLYSLIIRSPLYLAVARKMPYSCFKAYICYLEMFLPLGEPASSDPVMSLLPQSARTVPTGMEQDQPDVCIGLLPMNNGECTDDDLASEDGRWVSRMGEQDDQIEIGFTTRTTRTDVIDFRLHSPPLYDGETTCDCDPCTRTLIYLAIGIVVIGGLVSGGILIWKFG